MSIQFAIPASPDTGLAPVLDGIPHGLLIAGVWVAASDDATMPVINPATEQIIATVADASVADAERAVEAAAAAQAAWAVTPPRARADVSYRTYQLMIDRTDRLAEIHDLGRPSDVPGPPFRPSR
jgi:succinate-semialdehyde dehydrogenase / glutarate-semialdehyde dehydrogenase